MPEIPDLEVFQKNLTRLYENKKVKHIDFAITKHTNRPVADYKKALEGQQLRSIRRSGKELFFEFENGSNISVHLMLHGKFAQFEKTNEEKYPVFEILFEDGSGLAVTDFQKQAMVKLNPEEKNAPDALSSKVNKKFLIHLLQDSDSSIKALLVDQNKIRGIGNAYVDEILWDAKISPLSISNKIPEERIAALAKSIRNVLNHAEKEILKRYPNTIEEKARDFLEVHRPRKEKSLSGAQIKHTTINSRKTYYTDEQVLYR